MKTLTSAEFAILSLLAEGPRHGYELEALIEARGYREWTDIGFSSIYFVLGKLAQMGLAQALPGAGGGKARKPYVLTREGREQLVRQAETMIAVPAAVKPPVLLGMAVWPLLSEGVGREALQAREAALGAETARLRMARDAQSGLPDFARALFDYSLAMIEADLEWTRKARMELGVPMEKIDFKKTMKTLYQPKNRDFDYVEVPQMQFVMVDGEGDPNVAPAYQAAVQWLYAVSFAMKFAAKAQLGSDYTVPPLEGLWWADDPADFVGRNKDRWKWTMMIMAPDFLAEADFESAKAKAEVKLGAAPGSLRLERYDEGLCLQALHHGSYDDEGPVLRYLHEEVMPREGLTFNGHHHEIYLGDPRKTEPAKLRTILRQPVRKV
jgi:DNA-binding PadR family transcriptional regulator